MKSVDLEQFSFSKHPWAREGIMKTIAVITSKAKSTRNETSIQVEMPAPVKGSSEAATLLQGKDWNLIQHGELGRGENKVKTKARFLNDHLKAAEGGLLGQDVKKKLF